MKTLILFSLLFSLNSFAESLKIVNFNTMCDFCGDKEKYGSFKQRLNSMADTLNRHDADLVSLQEFTFVPEAKKVISKLKTKYIMVYTDGKLANYADPILLIRKDRFKVLDEGGFWLGPNKKFPLGWKLAFPRRIKWAKILDTKNQRSFVFIGTHFDNSGANKEPSAHVLVDFVKEQTLPVLFAGDTNLRTEHTGYSTLTTNGLIDTFPGTENVKFFANAPYDIHDACNKSKADTFPECRIDHVLHTQDFPYDFKSWSVDVYRYNGTLGFVSDHRAVIVEFQ